MKGIIVGDWKYRIYEQALFDGLATNNVEVFKFSTSLYVKNDSVFSRLKNRLSLSQGIFRTNTAFLKKVQKINPDFIFFQRVTEILPSTIKKIKKDNPKIVLLNYHNDNPFNNANRYYFSRNFFRLIKLSDINYTYRDSNRKDYEKFGAKNVKLLPPYYKKGVDDKLKEPFDKINDVVFIGHFENDGRDKICKYLFARGINLKVFGDFWDRSIIKNNPNVAPIRLHKPKYFEVIKQSKIALVFLSKRNGDVYTRRNFEIPIVGTFMLTPENEEIKEFYIKNVECGMYKSKEELYQLIEYYLYHEQERELIAKNGYLRCVNSYDNINSAKKILKDIAEL